MGSEMSPLMVPLASEVRIESFIFLPTAKPLGSGNTLFLGGGGPYIFLVLKLCSMSFYLHRY